MKYITKLITTGMVALTLSCAEKNDYKPGITVESEIRSFGDKNCKGLFDDLGFLKQGIADYCVIAPSESCLEWVNTYFMTQDRFNFKCGNGKPEPRPEFLKPINLKFTKNQLFKI